MRERLLTRDSKLLLLSAFLNSVPVGYINVVPLVYLAAIGYDPTTIGLIYSVSALALVLGLIPFGLVADRYGRKKLLIIGSFLPCITYAVFGLTLDPLPLIIVSAIGGIGFAGGLGVAMANPTLIPMLATSTPDDKRSVVFGILQSAWAVALMLGSLMSILPSLLTSSLAQTERTAHFESYFVMMAITAASVIPVLYVRENRNGADSAKSKDRGKITRQFGSGNRGYFSSVGSWSRITQFSVVFACSGFGLGVLVQLLPTWYSMKFGVGEGLIGMWLALSNLATVISIPMIPFLVSRRGTVTTAAICGVLGSLLVGIMPFSPLFETAAVLFTIRSVIYGIFWSLLHSYMMGVVGEGERGTMVGFAYTAWGVGISAGVLIGAEFLAVGLLNLPFSAAIICYIVASAAVMIFFRKIRPPEEARGFGLSRVTE